MCDGGGGESPREVVAAQLAGKWPDNRGRRVVLDVCLSAARKREEREVKMNTNPKLCYTWAFIGMV